MEYIMLPRAWLDKIPSVLHRGIFLSMLERADEQGRLTISVRGFADEIGVSYQVVRTAIAKLSANATINAIATQRLTQITICDYANYATPPRKQQRKANATINAIATQPKATKFIPPTDEEVSQYVAEKGYHFDPAQFVPFYQSKGWMIGKNPMKDWKAACRTWELEWQKKHGEQFYYQIRQPTPQRTADGRQIDRYSALEAAAGAVIRRNTVVNATNYDRG